MGYIDLNESPAIRLMRGGTDGLINLITLLCLSTKLLRISDNTEHKSYATDANIDASCHRTHHSSNLVVCVGKSILMIYN